jgi:hypothetical protein
LKKPLKKSIAYKAKPNVWIANAQFPIENLYDACPACGEHLIHITAGKNSE